MGGQSRSAERFEALYSRGLPAGRSGALFGAFPYPTKISPEAIALFIAAHTDPGETVFDGFAGSGTTGLAALLCEEPSEDLRRAADRLGIRVRWGARNAVLYELSALGGLVGQTLTNPPEPDAFFSAASGILDAAVREDGWLYEAHDPHGRTGSIRYSIWSDLLLCPACRSEATFWECCVSRAPAEISSRFRCPTCGKEEPLEKVDRLNEISEDDLIGSGQAQRKRKLVWIYGRTGNQNWSRPAEASDDCLLLRAQREPVPDAVPRAQIPWGDLHRSGYHRGISHVHHFYTRRNLLVFGRLWERAESESEKLRDALRFWLLSYNAAHATIMTRVVAKTGHKDLVVTSAQPGVLYVSGLPVEKNLIAGLRRKLTTICRAFTQIHGRRGRVQVVQRSSCDVDLPDSCVDYVFTDPPFGGNIPYAEVHFLNEAWLGRHTDRREEAIVSPTQNKTLSDYRELLARALSEARRVLRPGRKATLVFHSSSAATWNALQAAYTQAGFGVERAGVLAKSQGSFKQVTAGGTVRGDPILLLGKRDGGDPAAAASVWAVADGLRQDAELATDPVERTAERLYSRFVSSYLTRDLQVPVDAQTFYRWHAKQEASGGSSGGND